MKQLLINPIEIKEVSPFANLSDEYLLPSILTATDMDLECVLGTNLLDKLTGCIDPEQNGVITDDCPEEYSRLIADYVKPLLVNLSIVHCIPRVWAKLCNQGLQTYSNNGQMSTSHQDMDYQRQEYRAIAKRYETRLVKYLNAHASEIKEWHTCRDCADTPSKTNKNSCNIFIP